MKLTDFTHIKDISKSCGVLDTFYLMAVINDYNQGEFLEMARLINEYGKHRFFQDLYILFDNQGAWRSRTNQYLNFVGITIQYMKFMSDDIQRPPSE